MMLAFTLAFDSKDGRYVYANVTLYICVKIIFQLHALFQSERILSFIPPDGNFRLLSYHIGSQSIVAIPIYVRHNISLKEPGGGRLDITVGPKQTIGRTVSYLS